MTFFEFLNRPHTSRAYTPPHKTITLGDINTGSASSKMDHPPPPESKVVDPMMRDLFGKNHHEVSNDCAIKIQKLEARLTSGKPRRVLSPGDSKMMLNATTTTGGGGTPIDGANAKADDETTMTTPQNSRTRKKRPSNEKFSKIPTRMIILPLSLML